MVVWRTAKQAVSVMEKGTGIQKKTETEMSATKVFVQANPDTYMG